MLIATHSGLRGRPGPEMSAAAADLVGGFVAALRRGSDRPAVGVACDGRATAEALCVEVIETLCRHGADVVDFGIVSTPTAKVAARVRGLAGALVVTGSHLKDEWTGIKPIAAPHYIPVDVRELPPPHAPRPGGSVRRDSFAAADHVQALLASVNADFLWSTGLTVDVAGGAGPTADLLLERVRGRAGNGTVDVRLFLDPDGDRVELGDERGYRAGPEATFPLVARARRPSVVVKGADTSSSVDLVVAAWAGRVHASPAGELNLVRTLLDCSGALAGEGNGGVVVPEVGLARDGLAAGLAVLELVARTATPLSELVSALPVLAVRRSEVECDGERGRVILERLAQEVGTELDDPHMGVRVQRPSGAWGLARSSGTEPLVRITAEAETEEEAAELHDELREALTR